MESVGLESVVETQDVTSLRDLISDFCIKTGSKHARNILNSWEQEIQNFIKVGLDTGNKKCIC